ncbi:hypothetical protein EV195_11172 [Tenacibaculum skagerrakense]|uniref:Uncharacterized protein n=1 Tax=Tenacibaculum skagerrakense TaxID=186571 RepID=A0A4R2NLX1_9FLAO|nr:hypothetical protein [Tenacibaculum skagerrakense]TCP22643.1 hypothetical protein EV195_11172 [Tenacibaculum skagerrakense]
MKTATIKILKDELKHQSSDELLELCLKLVRFKKENKELLTYLLFEASNEDRYIESIKLEVDELFNEINTKSFFYIRKSVRKILSTLKKYIRYSKKKNTEVELLLYFCLKLKQFTPSILKSPRLQNIYDTQMRMAKKAMENLHEDLQYDYNMFIEDQDLI